MSKLNLTLFDGECEILSYDTNADGYLEIMVDEGITGRLFIGSLIFDMTMGECRISADSIPDGIYSPILYRERDMIAFPKIRKTGNLIKPMLECEAEILKASQRARRAVSEADTLAVEVERLKALIEGTRLAIGQEK